MAAPAGIALGMSIAHADNHHGTVGGIETSTANKVFSVFNGLGSIAFAFSFSGALLVWMDCVVGLASIATGVLL